MCAGAAWAARVGRLVFGAADPKAGAAGSLYNFAADPRLNHETEVVAGSPGRRSARDLLTDVLPIETQRPDPVLSRPGGMRERPNRMVSKTIVAQVTVGSNPTPSARTAKRALAIRPGLFVV